MMNSPKGAFGQKVPSIRTTKDHSSKFNYLYLTAKNAMALRDDVTIH